MGFSNFGRKAGFVLILGSMLFAGESVFAAGGLGGSTGYGSTGYGSSGYGSTGYGSTGYGSRGGLLLSGRQPVRNLLGRVAGRVGNGLANVRYAVGNGIRNRVAYRQSLRYGSHGGSTGFGSYGSHGGSTGYTSLSSSSIGGGSVGSYSNYGSLGQTYTSAIDTSYSNVSTLGTSYAAPVSSFSPSVDYAQPMETGFYSPTDTMVYGNETIINDPGMISNGGISNGSFIDGYPSDPQFGTPMGDSPVESGIIQSPQFDTSPGVIYESNEGGSVIEGSPTPSGGMETPPSPGPADSGSSAGSEDIARVSTRRALSGQTAILSVELPEEAKVYINGKLTTTEGKLRSFVSRNLKPNKNYEYRVKAVMNVDGNEIVRNQNVRISTGSSKSISFDFNQPSMTRLAVNVPEDAKVTLAGHEMKATGHRVRYFTTRSLKEGETWDDYTILVSVKRGGKTITKKETVNITGGQTRLVKFDFDSVGQIASK